ncbi:MAG: hypothetical protein WC775_06015 [Patescibacteria group bacterium]|jgi:hypothetical protein
MPKENLDYRVLTDIDFAYVYAPVAWGTIWALLSGSLSSPGRYDQIEPKQLSPVKKALAQVMAFTHTQVLRPEKPKAVAALQVLKAQFEQAQLQAQFGVLSGRTPETHKMTRKLLDPRIGTLFSPDLIFLNPGFKSAEFKIKTIVELVRQGLRVLMIEDDFKTGWQLTTHPDIPRDMLDVYLIKNLSTSRALRYHSIYDNTALPWNLHIMPSHEAIKNDIALHYLP